MIEALKSRWLASTAIQYPHTTILGGRYNPQRLLQADGRYLIARIPSHVGLATYVEVRRSMALAAYAGRITPLEDIPADAVGPDDHSKIRPGEYPPEYLALMGQLEKAASGG